MIGSMSYVLYTTSIYIVNTNIMVYMFIILMERNNIINKPDMSNNYHYVVSFMCYTNRIYFLSHYMKDIRAV